MMKCQKCQKNFPEREIHESHDVPCYLFEDKEKGKEIAKQVSKKFFDVENLQK